MTLRGIRSFGEKSKTADQIILELLRQGGKTFGEIQTHLKNEGSTYTRKGLSLRLDSLRDHGLVNRRPIKQGHYSYLISKKGERDIGFQAQTFSSSLDGLLRAYLPPFSKNKPIDEEHFINQMTTRIGIFVLFSFFHSLRLTLQKPDLDKILVMSEWLDNSFSFKSIDRYFMDKKDKFLKFRSDEEAFESYFSSQIKQDGVNRLESIFRKMYPSEYEFCEQTINFQSYYVNNELANIEYEKIIEQYLKRIHRKHVNHKNSNPQNCPECHREYEKKPPSANLLDVRKRIFDKTRNHR